MVIQLTVTKSYFDGDNWLGYCLDTVYCWKLKNKNTIVK